MGCTSRFGYHFVQSFSPDDHLTPEQVHEIGLKTMKEYLGNSAEFIIATHTDKPHLHNVRPDRVLSQVV